MTSLLKKSLLVTHNLKAVPAGFAAKFSSAANVKDIDVVVNEKTGKKTKNVFFFSFARKKKPWHLVGNYLVKKKKSIFSIPLSIIQSFLVKENKLLDKFVLFFQKIK